MRGRFATIAPVFSAWLFTLGVLSLSAYAQTSRGAITGVVIDPSGAAVAGASIGLTGIDTGVAQATRTNDAGIYRLDALDPGPYRLTVSHPGFKTYAADSV